MISDGDALSSDFLFFLLHSFFCFSIFEDILFKEAWEIGVLSIPGLTMFANVVVVVHVVIITAELTNIVLSSTMLCDWFVLDNRSISLLGVAHSAEDSGNGVEGVDGTSGVNPWVRIFCSSNCVWA